MPRRNRPGYAGATSRVTLERAAQLGSGWVVQPKIDGQYVEVETDDTGCVVVVCARSGRRVSGDRHQLVGERLFSGPAVLCGELEAHTERGIRAALARPGGRPRVHLFDMQGAGDYATRRARLYRGWVEADDARRRDGRCEDGQFRPAGVRSVVVEQRPVSAVREFYAAVCEAGGEGVVLVDTSAELEASRSKLKLKPVDSLDCPVVSVAGKRAKLRHPEGHVFTVGTGGHSPAPGELWEVAHEGTYASGPVRFPCLIRRRDDIVCLPQARSGVERETVAAVVAGPW